MEKQPRAARGSRDVPTPPPPPSFRDKSPSPIPEGGLGDSLSIEETNKLRAKLGLKPLEVSSSSSAPAKPADTSSSLAQKDTSDISEDETKITDDLGEFYHKPAANITELKNAEKIREKIKERREKRKLEESLKKTKTLGESDSDDDVNNWVERNRIKALQKKAAEKRAKLLEEMDEEFGVGALMEEQSVRQGGSGKRRDHNRQSRRGQDEYKYSSLRGLKVEHDVSEFTEGRTVILTLKDADVLDEEAKDTLVNVNIMDTERYRKNVENKKHRPGGSYGYECYEDGEEEGDISSHRSVLKKYDDEIAGGTNKSSFVIGSTAELEKEKQRRKMMEIKCKLENKRIVSLNEQLIRPATDYFTEEEMAKFKKPKKRKDGGKKLRTKLKADDLLPLPGDVPDGNNLRSRRGRQESYGEMEADDDGTDGQMKREWKLEPEEDLERVLSKARRLKQKEAIICKAVKVEIKEEVRHEEEDDVEQEGLVLLDNKIVLNETAEFCRTLGDIPTYGMAGNREADLNDLMDVEEEDGGVGVSDEQLLKDMEMEGDEEKEERGGGGGHRRRGQWSSVAVEDQMEEEEEYGKRDSEVTKSEGQSEKAVLDDEPDVGTGVAGALRLAMSKGYLEKEEANKPSNTRMAYLQAKNYSIDDKAQK